MRPLQYQSTLIDSTLQPIECAASQVVGEGGTVVWLLLTAVMAPGHRWFRFRGIGPSPDLPVQSRLKFVEGSLIRFQPSRVTPVVFSVPNGLGAFLIRSTHPIVHQSFKFIRARGVHAENCGVSPSKFTRDSPSDDMSTSAAQVFTIGATGR